MSIKKHIIEFLAAVSGKRGDLDCWLECNNEEEVRAAVNGALHEKDELILAQQARIEQLVNAIVQFRNEPCLGRMTTARATAGYLAMERAAIDATDDLSALRAHDAKLLADALRYRAIKQWHKAYVLGGIAGGMNIHLLTSTRWPEQLDAAIDKAIEKGCDK